MAMVVQHNITAMNSSRMLGITTGQQAKTAEKLSSGYRINRAGDDAAGLKISEKMRSQIRGLQKASTNAQDGVSLIQTAEGALNEAHSILQRMNELAVQGANDTNQTIDRDAINEELSALVTELDRISETTQFNKQNLLDGSFKGKNLQVGANVYQSIGVSINKMNANCIGLSTTKYSIDYISANGGCIYKTSADARAAASIVKHVCATSNKTFYKASTTALTTTEAKAKSLLTVASFTSTISFQAKVDNYSMANMTISKVQDAINKVSSQRSALGALQNRLEHTIANLDNVAENTQAAESRIRDTDMAAEMVEYSKNQILAQAGQSMLAQANQATQGVLSLLQ